MTPQGMNLFVDMQIQTQSVKKQRTRLPRLQVAEDPPATSPSGGGPGGSGNDDRDDLEEELKLLEVVKDVTSNETLWPDNWFEYYCPYITSCVGQYVKYYTFSFGTAIPNPLTGTIVGWHIAFTLDQYGDWFFGIGIDAGKNVLGVSASLVEGRFANDQLPSNDIAEQRFLRSYLTGNSFQGFLVPIFYIGANYSPSVGEFSAEDGVGIPQGGVAWTHSWLISGGQ